jgi:murein L,D-transpeptidase YcbB/YkuD
MMKNWVLLSSIFCAIFLSCDKDSGQTNNQPKTKNFISKLFKPNINAEYIDSLSLDRFIISHPQYKPYKKKLHKFYLRRNYELAWSFEGEFRPQASMFLNQVRSTQSQVTDPNMFITYDLERRINDAYGKKRDSLIRKNIDMELSGTYFKYSQKLWKGFVDPQDERLDWFIVQKKIKYGKTLDSILESNDGNPFEKYMPVHVEYKRLLKQLNTYQGIKKNNEWTKLDSVILNQLSVGDTSIQISHLKRRLLALGDLVYDKEINNEYDLTLSEAIKKFQERHGLKTTGKLSGLTLSYLNLSLDQIIKKILVNLERWKWVPENVADNYLLVNIPDFSLNIFEKGLRVHTMKVIVGKAMTHTPIFNDQLKNVVINPYWNIPQSIATEEILPAMQKDSSYLERMNIEVYSGYDYEHPIDPLNFDWDTIRAEKFPFQLRQKPGNGNALGRLKFIFPNNFDVYLHDTPQKYLFQNQERDYSHGCIRIEDPFWLASYLLEDKSEKELRRIKEENKWYKIPVNKQLPVYIVYFTAWVDNDNRLNFRDDIYNHDRKLAHLLFED